VLAEEDEPDVEQPDPELGVGGDRAAQRFALGADQAAVDQVQDPRAGLAPDPQGAGLGPAFEDRQDVGDGEGVQRSLQRQRHSRTVSGRSTVASARRPSR
jgi:hypothetical protein